MSILARKRPFQDLVALRSDQNNPRRQEAVPAFRDRPTFLPIDMYQTDEEYVIVAALPGVKAEDIDIQATGNEFVIKAETKADEETSARNYIHRERRSGQAMRAITLPDGINPDKVTASFDRGLLTCKIPKQQPVKTVRVDVN